jgi:hypothetical protein
VTFVNAEEKSKFYVIKDALPQKEINNVIVESNPPAAATCCHSAAWNLSPARWGFRRAAPNNEAYLSIA